MSSVLAMLTSVSTGEQSLVLINPVASAASPGQELPGTGQPAHPWLPGMGRPERPDNTLPGSPGRPSQGLPPLPPDMAHPGHPLPLPPNRPDNSLPIYPGTPDHELPPPGTIWPPLPPSIPSGKAIALVAISGVGYRWTVIDTSLTAGYPLPTPPAAPPGFQTPTTGPVPPVATPA